MPTNNKIPNCPPLRFPEFFGEWTQTTLGEACSVIGGGTPRTDVDDYWNGDIQWFTPSEIGVNKFVSRSERTITEQGMNNSGAKLLPLGTVLLTTRATIGEASITTCPCTTNQGFQSLVIDRRITTTEFVYQKVETLKRELFSRANGSTFKEISASEVRSIPISLPSLAEQKKIADFLSLIDERIQCLSETIKERKREKAALLNQLFSQKIRFLNFSDDWQGTTLEKEAFFQKGVGISKESLSEEGHPVILYGELYTTYKSEIISHIKSKTGLNGSDLVRTNGGEVIIPSSGETALDIATARCVIPSGVILGGDLNVITLKNGNGIFLSYLLNGIKKKEIAKVAQGSSVVHLYSSELKKLFILFPSPAEQKKIADFLSLVDERIEVEEELLQQYERQKRYLLKQMFV